MIESALQSAAMANEESVKATRTTIEIGSFAVDGFMLLDGSYRMSQTQTAECLNMPEINTRRFLDSRAIKALLGKGYTPDAVGLQAEKPLLIYFGFQQRKKVTRQPWRCLQDQ